jgi:Kef-type K+ transport system membrane component KefB
VIAAAAESGHGAAALLGTLAAVLVACKLAGEVAQRFKLPAVLGELVVGVVLGGSLLGLLDPGQPAIAALAEIGVVLLLFAIGLHTDIRLLRAVGGAATAVALTGVAIPFALGYWVASLLGVPPIPAIVCGAALTATSVGVSARVLSDLGRLGSTEGRIVLGAAVLDDIVGLIILAVVTRSVGGQAVSAAQIAGITAAAIGFVIVALFAGARTIPPTFRLAERVKADGAIGVFGVVLAFGLAWLADSAGSAIIIGAFAAGLVLHPLPQRNEIERTVTTLAYFFVPIFFASVGAAVDLGAMLSPTPLLIGGGLIVVGVVGKVAAGYAPWWFHGNKLLVGVAMVPRGEVGLIFAQMGLASGALTPALYGAVMLMVLATTLVTPPVLAVVAERERAAEEKAKEK